MRQNNIIIKMKLIDIKQIASNGTNKITSTGLGKMLAEVTQTQVSAAKTTAKILFFAADMKSPEKSLKKYAEEIAGCPLGAAIDNGYKAHVVLRRLLATEEKTEVDMTITEECFDALGIESLINASAIINAVDGHDNESDTLKKLVVILKSHKNVSDMKKALADLKKAVKEPVSTGGAGSAEAGEAASEESPEVKNLRAQLAAQTDRVNKLAAGLAMFIGESSEETLAREDVQAFIASAGIAGDLPEGTVPEAWQTELREIYALKLGSLLPAKKGKAAKVAA